MNVLLFSGGLDSTALAWRDKPDRLIFIDYGQIPARGEERASRTIAKYLKIPLAIKRVDLRAFGAGPMAGRRALSKAAPEFWPYRNQLLITLAAMGMANEQVDVLSLGTVVTDRAHPDGRELFLEAIRRVVKLQRGPAVKAPAIRMTTEALVRSANVPLRVLGWTFSCHTGEWACGSCRGCVKHRHVMNSLGFQ